MDAQVYEKAWGVVEPLLDDFLLLVQCAKEEEPETAPSRVISLYDDLVNIRTHALASLGVTFEEILQEQSSCIARLEASR